MLTPQQREAFIRLLWPKIAGTLADCTELDHLGPGGEVFARPIGREGTVRAYIEARIAEEQPAMTERVKGALARASLTLDLEAARARVDAIPQEFQDVILETDARNEHDGEHNDV
jgi:hypothetical protein